MEQPFECCRDAEPIRRSRFAHDVEQLLGDTLDLDPLFFEESWTVGKSIALENLQRRRQRQTEQERPGRAAWELDYLETLLADRAATIDGSRNLAQTWNARQATASYGREVSSESWTPQDWTPQDWTPLDRFRQSWIPEGWMPAALERKQEIRQPQPCHETGEHSMTIARAQQLLDISSTSSLEQIRSAYRRSVNQYHPDRLQDSSEAVRRNATQQMAAINEAYRVLRSAMLQAA